MIYRFKKSNLYKLIFKNYKKTFLNHFEFKNFKLFTSSIIFFFFFQVEACHCDQRQSVKFQNHEVIIFATLEIKTLSCSLGTYMVNGDSFYT